MSSEPPPPPPPGGSPSPVKREQDDDDDAFRSSRRSRIVGSSVAAIDGSIADSQTESWLLGGLDVSKLQWEVLATEQNDNASMSMASYSTLSQTFTRGDASATTFGFDNRTPSKMRPPTTIMSHAIQEEDSEDQHYSFGGVETLNFDALLGPDSDDEADGQALPLPIPPRPRRLWKVSDTKVPTFPASTVPLPPAACSCRVRDAPPSAIAIRIAECLRTRSVAAEFDEEAVQATCLTSDRVHFVVHLWKYHSTAPDSTSDSILVECVRLSGDTLSFHAACRAVLNAARSLDSGKDLRKTYQAAAAEYPRRFPLLLVDDDKDTSRNDSHDEPSPLLQRRPRSLSTIPFSSPARQLVVDAQLEHCSQLLRKDRLGAQVAGMESLVNLTDPTCVGDDAALKTALRVLGAQEGAVKEGLSDLMLRLLVDREVSRSAEGKRDGRGNNMSFSFMAGCTGSLLGRDTEDTEQHEPSVAESDDAELHRASPRGALSSTVEEDRHGGVMRALALLALANALTVLANAGQLRSVLMDQAPVWASQAVVAALQEDLEQGATRPVSVCAGTMLASPHEAVNACRCLGLLGKHHPSAKRRILTATGAPATTTLQQLEKARRVGKSTHTILAEEARTAYQLLTEDERSC